MQEDDLTGRAPKGPHLAVLTDESGLALGIPVGARMFLVHAPGKPDGMVPLILTDVGLSKLTFRCNCGQPQCTRVVKFKGEWRGLHPQKHNPQK